MNKTAIANNSPADENLAHEAQVDHYIGEMKRLQQQMAGERDEIRILQEETRSIFANVMASLKAA